MKYKEWYETTQTAIDEAGLQCALDEQTGSWEENHITTQLLNAIGKEGDVAWEDLAQHVKWSAYKLSGKPETLYGDLALIVKVYLAPSVVVEGVAFYEAKRQYFGEGGKVEGFKALKERQTSRIASQTHASHVLLYDIFIEKKRFFAKTVPTEFVQSLFGTGLETKRALHRYGYPWFYALGRNLRGFDLDFRPEAVEAIKASVKKGLAFVLSAAISKDPSIEPTLDPLPDELGFYEFLGVTADDAEQDEKPKLDSGYGPS